MGIFSFLKYTFIIFAAHLAAHRLKITVLDNRLTDGGEAVGLMRRPPFTPRKIPGTHFF
jgi:hypothetical protein